MIPKKGNGTQFSLCADSRMLVGANICLVCLNELSYIPLVKNRTKKKETSTGTLAEKYDSSEIKSFQSAL